MNLSEIYTADRPILKGIYVRYTPPSLKLVNGEKNQFFIDIPREDIFFSFKDKGFDLDFISIQTTGDARFADGDHVQSVNLGPYALFNEYRLPSCSSGKEKEENDIAHIICLMYSFTLKSRDSDAFSIGFPKNFGARVREITDNKRSTGNCHVRKKDLSRFAERQETAAYGLGYKVTFQRISDNFVLSHEARTDAELLVLEGTVNWNDLSWYVQPYASNIAKQK